jgi:hypothetical protein
MTRKGGSLISCRPSESLRFFRRCLQRINGDIPVRIVPDRLAILHQHRLRAGMLGPDLIGKG